MKKTSKIAAMIAAMALAATMMVPATVMTASAATTTITIDSGTSDSVFSAYKLLNATVSGTNYTYSMNPTYSSLLQTVTGQSTDAAVITYIQGLTGTDVRTFADAVYNAIKAASPAIAADATTTSGTSTITGADTLNTPTIPTARQVQIRPARLRKIKLLHSHIHCLLIR